MSVVQPRGVSRSLGRPSTAVVEFSTATPAAAAVTVDVGRERVEARGLEFEFTLGPIGCDMLLTGVDAIGMTLNRLGGNAACPDRERIARPWIYPGAFQPND